MTHRISIDALPLPTPRPIASEFVRALGERYTYDPRRNVYVLFGFLWGLPIPFFSIGLDSWISGRVFTLACVAEHPIHLFFLLHPLLFAAVFGALGTVRHRRDVAITRLVDRLNHHVDELAHANERLKELDHLKAQFVANVTHELKTPLVSIRGYNEAILEGRFGDITDMQRRGLAVAVRNVDRLQKLIDELLEFEKMESGSYRIAAEDFDLVPLLQAAVETFKPQLEAKRLACAIAAPERLTVRADREKIARVVTNLLSNAVKFSPEDSSLGIAVSEHRAAGQAVVTVWDRGPGIPAAAQKHLFTRFWQADGSSRRRHGGTGLGLVICKGILEAHGSRIRVLSSEGQGTRVLFNLPLVKEPSHVETKSAHSGRR